MGQSLRDYMSLLETKLPAAWLRVDSSVSPRHQISAYLEKSRREKRSAAVFFSSVNETRLPVVGNLLTDRARTCLALDLETDTGRKEYGRALRSKLEKILPPVQVQTAPVQKVKIEGPEADLTVFPFLTHCSSDQAPSLLMGAAVARNPQSGAVTLSLPQSVVLGKNAMGLVVGEESPLSGCLTAASEAAQPLEVALVIGMHPAYYMAAAAGADGPESLGRVGSLLGEGLTVTRTTSGDLPIPSQAEIVIEGSVSPGDSQKITAPASPNGYEGREKEVPVLRVKAVTHREDAIFQEAGIFGERLYLPTPIREAEALRTLQKAVPEVIDVRIPAVSNGYHAYVQLDQKRMGQGKKAILAALGVIPDVKTVFAVDKDVDMEVDREVLWVFATRLVADRDLFMVPGVISNSEDPCAYEITRRGRGEMVTRLGIDATTPIGLPYEIPKPTRIPGTEGIKLEEYLEEWSDGTA